MKILLSDRFWIGSEEFNSHVPGSINGLEDISLSVKESIFSFKFNKNFQRSSRWIRGAYEHKIIFCLQCCITSNAKIDAPHKDLVFYFKLFWAGNFPIFKFNVISRIIYGQEEGEISTLPFLNKRFGFLRELFQYSFRKWILPIFVSEIISLTQFREFEIWRFCSSLPFICLSRTVHLFPRVFQLLTLRCPSLVGKVTGNAGSDSHNEIRDSIEHRKQVVKGIRCARHTGKSSIMPATRRELVRGWA